VLRIWVSERTKQAVLLLLFCEFSISVPTARRLGVLGSAEADLELLGDDDEFDGMAFGTCEIE
jgi:hypothetical protein